MCNIGTYNTSCVTGDGPYYLQGIILSDTFVTHKRKEKLPVSHLCRYISGFSQNL